MGGGAAMRAVGKVAGVITGGFRGGSQSIPFPENLTSAAYKAKASRPVAGIISSSDSKVEASATPKPYWDTEDWDFAGSEEETSDVGEPMGRLVFGGAPTLEEAKEATSQLRTAVHEAYLSNNSSGGSDISYPENMSVLSNSGHLETKACIASDILPPKHAIQAFRLLNESSAAQTVVASIASDPNVWNAVLQNEALVEFLHSQKTDMNGSFDESASAEEIPDWQSPKFFSEDESNAENELANTFNSFFQNVKVRVEEMMNRLSSFFQNLFASPEAVEGGATSVDKAMGASIMGLVVMVVMVVALRRA